MKLRILLTGIFAISLVSSALAAPEVDIAEPELPLRNHDAWAMQIDQEAETVTHDLSGLLCPFELPGGYSIESAAQYKLGGHDVSCTYVREGRRAFVSYYLSWYGQPASSREQSSGVIDTLRSTKNLGPEVKNMPVTASLGETKTDCHYIEHIEKDGTEDRKTAVRSCSIGGWVYKTRMTWYEGESFVDADIGFNTLQSDMGSMLSTCQTISLPTKEAAKGETDSVIALALLTSLASEDLEIEGGDEEDKEKVKKLFYNRSLQDGPQCVLDVAETSSHAYTLQTSANAPLTKLAYTRSDLYQREAAPIVWVSGFGLGDLVAEDNTYAAWARDTEGVEHIVDTFKTVPSFPQMRELLSNFLNGKVKSLASYRRDENGNSTLSINTDVLEDEPDASSPENETASDTTPDTPENKASENED